MGNSLYSKLKKIRKESPVIAHVMLVLTSDWPLRVTWFPRDSLLTSMTFAYRCLQENFEELSQGTVAYINLDGAVMGNYTLGVQASPLLHSIVLDASRVVTPPSTTEGFTTLYDMWTKHSQIHDVTDKPKYGFSLTYCVNFNTIYENAEEKLK